MTTNTTNLVQVTCARCGGAGVYCGGTCYRCHGVGYTELVTEAVLERRKKARKAAAAKREQDRKAQVDAYIRGRMAEFLAAGLTLADYHDETCHCGEAAACTEKYGHTVTWAAVQAEAGR